MFIIGVGVKKLRTTIFGIILVLPLFRELFLIGGLKARAEGPRKFFNLESLKRHFLDPAAPPPVATYGPGLHAEMHRMENKDYHSKVLLDIFFRPFILARYFF